MAITGFSVGFFVVWTEKDISIEKKGFEKGHWEKVESNLTVFFKSFVCPVLLHIKEIIFCGTCENVILSASEISKGEIINHGSVTCHVCLVSYHLKCQDVLHADLSDDWICENCILSCIEDVEV